MGWIDAHDVHLAGKKGQFLKRQLQAALAWMGFDFGKELGGGEFAADHVAFELGHVDAIGREAAERRPPPRR